MLDSVVQVQYVLSAYDTYTLSAEIFVSGKIREIFRTNHESMLFEIFASINFCESPKVNLRIIDPYNRIFF